MKVNDERILWRIRCPAEMKTDGVCVRNHPPESPAPTVSFPIAKGNECSSALL